MLIEKRLKRQSLVTNLCYEQNYFKPLRNKSATSNRVTDATATKIQILDVLACR